MCWNHHIITSYLFCLHEIPRKSLVYLCFDETKRTWKKAPPKTLKHTHVAGWRIVDGSNKMTKNAMTQPCGPLSLWTGRVGRWAVIIGDLLQSKSTEKFWSSAERNHLWWLFKVWFSGMFHNKGLGEKMKKTPTRVDLKSLLEANLTNEWVQCISYWKWVMFQLQ